MAQAVILCGGQGSRLWPLSRTSFPKQFITVREKVSLLQDTLARVRLLNLPSKPLLICNHEHQFFVRANLKSLKIDGELIVEPVGKNTAPAIALACFKALESNPDEVLIILPSDHLIQDQNKFSLSCSKAIKLAQEDFLVTFGVSPTKPETGYGYIQKGQPLTEGSFLIEKFLEKPNKDLARDMLESGQFFWNSGMFVFKAKVFLNELKKYSPDIFSKSQAAYQGSTSVGSSIYPNPEFFSKCPENSIDYAVMEKTDKAAVVPFDGDWSDLGSWAAFYETSQKDESGNVIKGDVIAAEAQNCYIQGTNRLITALGIENLAVIETKDALFISPLDRSQDVKKLVSKLKDANRSEVDIPPIVYRPWGSYEGLVRGERFQVKKIIVQPGEQLSLQMHHHRAEHWIIVEGSAEVQIGNETKLYCENQSTYIPVGTIHRLKNPGRIPLILIEVQSGSYLGEDDIVRLEDKYQRI